MSRLDEAFALADKINRSVEIDDDGRNLLRLDCLDAYEGSSQWAATFDSVIDDDYWYEQQNINNYPTAARASTPEDAIFAAAEKFCKLTGFKATNRKQSG